MSDRPIFSRDNPEAWPQDENGLPLSTEEVTVAIYELVKRGLIEIMFDENNRMWVRATPDGHAAYAIEEAFNFTDTDPFATGE